MANRSSASAGLIALLVVLVVGLYPALFLARVVAPEASLKGVPPWRQEWGPSPAPAPLTVEAATHLGPRLHAMARSGTAVALWDPLIGGGRAGWLSSAEEGGAPLPIVASFLARAHWAWTALVATEMACAFLSAWWVVRRLGLDGWAAAATGVVYAFSGAVAGRWLDWRGSALALGPLALLPVLMAPARWPRRALAWTAVLALLLLCGPPALPFVALALAREVLVPRSETPAARWGAITLATLLALAIWTPAPWLARAGAEQGGVRVSQAVSPPLSSPAALLAPAPTEVPSLSPAGREDASEAGLAFVGLATLLLAGVGLAARRREAFFWAGVFITALAAVAVPSPWLAALGGLDRPFGVLALAVAVLAGFGVDHLGHRAGKRWSPALAGALCAVLLVRVAPPALHQLPYAYPDDASLHSPVPPSAMADGSRVLALLTAMPPDVGATLGLADVRAADLSEEPAYAALLGATREGELSVPRALSERMARLGVRWVIEPTPLRVVTSEIFARVDVEETSGDEAGLTVHVPRDATRLALPAGAATGSIFLRQGVSSHLLSPDPTLAAESLAWSWFSVPPDAYAGEAVLLGAQLPPAGRIEVAWDSSELTITHEGPGSRVWSWGKASRFAQLAGRAGENSAATSAKPAPPPGDVHVRELRPGRVTALVSSPNASTLVAQIKYRPRLWHATIDGQPAEVERAEDVWSGVRVPSGQHEVVLEARLPRALWLAVLLGLVGVIALATMGRRP